MDFASVRSLAWMASWFSPHSLYEGCFLSLSLTVTRRDLFSGASLLALDCPGRISLAIQGLMAALDLEAILRAMRLAPVVGRLAGQFLD